MRTVAWADIAPLFDLPLAIFNAVFEVKRLIKEADIAPAGRIFDVMTAHWLTDGQRPSLGEAVAINYGIVIPKTLGASDWSADVLAPEQLEYAALDAVLCRLLWLTQQNELFDDIDKQCQELADADACCCADGTAWHADRHRHPPQAGRAMEGRSRRSRGRAARRLATAGHTAPAELQIHLREVLTDEA